MVMSDLKMIRDVKKAEEFKCMNPYEMSQRPASLHNHKENNTVENDSKALS